MKKTQSKENQPKNDKIQIDEKFGDEYGQCSEKGI